jgi:integrase
MQAHDLQFTPGPRPSRRTLRAAPQVSELVDLRREQVDFNHAVLQVRRVKKGTPATHPIIGDEMRALRRLQREQEPKSPFVFTSERGSPFTTAGFVRLVERAGESAGLGFKAHPHMLRHAWYGAAQHDADRAGRGMWRNGSGDQVSILRE